MNRRNVKNSCFPRVLLSITFLLIIFQLIPVSDGVFFSNLSSCDSSYLSKIQYATIRESKPDLIIEEIVTKPYNQFEDKYLCRVKNIGNETTDLIIMVEVTVKRLFLGMFPIKTVRHYRVGSHLENGLPPGAVIDILFAYESDLPVYGIYRYNCVVNPNQSIDESDYNNNFFSKTYVAFFGYD